MESKKDGESIEDAIIINATEDFQGIILEYAYLRRRFGTQDFDWELKKQSLIEQNNKAYDRMDLILKDGAKRSIFFDISSFFNKTKW